MNARSDPQVQLDRLFSTARIAHEAIFDLHGKLSALGAADEHTRELVGESAWIALEELPSVTSRARELAAVWDEQALLDPEQAGRTLEALRDELEQRRSDLNTLRSRHREIAAELSRRLRHAEER